MLNVSLYPVLGAACGTVAPGCPCDGEPAAPCGCGGSTGGGTNESHCCTDTIVIREGPTESREPLFIYADVEPGLVSGTAVFTDPSNKLTGWQYSVEVRGIGLLNPLTEVDKTAPGYFITKTDYKILPNELHIIYFLPRYDPAEDAGGGIADKFGIQDNLGIQNRSVNMEGFSFEMKNLAAGAPADLDIAFRQLPEATKDKVLYLDDTGKLFRGPLTASGPLTGTITAPSGTIDVPPGLWRELVLEVSGASTAVVSVGLSPGTTELADAILITGTEVVFVGRKLKTTVPIYITTTNNLLYELYKG